MSDTTTWNDTQAFSGASEKALDRPDPVSSANGNTTAPPLIDQAKQQAQKVVEQTQQKAGEVMEQARDKTKSWAEQQKCVTADSLHGVARAVRETGMHLRGQQDNPVHNYANFVEGSADAVERAAHYLRETDVDQMVGEVERFARRQPALFLGIAAALGFFAVRFLKSSGSSGSREQIGYNPDRRLPVPTQNVPTQNAMNIGESTHYGTTGATD